MEFIRPLSIYPKGSGARRLSKGLRRVRACKGAVHVHPRKRCLRRKRVRQTGKGKIKLPDACPVSLNLNSRELGSVSDGMRAV